MEIATKGFFGKNTFLTGDTHFGHENAIRHSKRPFSNVREMDEALIEIWNNIIKPKDNVYHHGDVAWRNIGNYVPQLNGNIHLIEGNHDFKFSKKVLHNLFKSVHSMFVLNTRDTSITMCHYAMRVWNKSHYGAYHSYAHSHGKLPPLGRSYDVGVDNNNLRPISIEDFISIVNKFKKGE